MNIFKSLHRKLVQYKEKSRVNSIVYDMYIGRIDPEEAINELNHLNTVYELQ